MSVQTRDDEAQSLIRGDTPYPGEIHIGHVDADAGAVAAFTFPPAGVLPTGFRHLKLIFSGRGTKAANTDQLNLTLSGGAGANYDRQNVSGMAAVPAAGEALNSTSFNLGINWPASTALANIFGGMTLWLYDYNNANKKPAFSAQAILGYNVTTGLIQSVLFGGYYNVAGIVTSLALSFAGGNLAQYSEADLFGVGQR